MHQQFCLHERSHVKILYVSFYFLRLFVWVVCLRKHERISIGWLRRGLAYSISGSTVAMVRTKEANELNTGVCARTRAYKRTHKLYIAYVIFLFFVFHHQSLHCEYMHARCTAPILHLIVSSLFFLLWASHIFVCMLCYVCLCAAKRSRLFYIDFEIIPRYNAQWLLYYRLCYSLLYLLYFFCISLSLCFSRCIHHHLIRLDLLSITWWPLYYSALAFFSLFGIVCIHFVHTTNCCCYFSFVAVAVHFSLYRIFCASDACDSIFLFIPHQFPLISHATTSVRLLHPVRVTVSFRQKFQHILDMCVCGDWIEQSVLVGWLVLKCIMSHKSGDLWLFD